MIKLSIILLIRVLCIGNSFSWDAVEQELVPLCDAKGIQIEVNNLYFGGCSLYQHELFLQRDTAAYDRRVWTNGPAPERQTCIKRDKVTLRQALRDGQYDFISFQQASHNSGRRVTFEPYLSILIDTVRAYQPNAQLCWMQTWAYSQDASNKAFAYYNNSQQDMYDSIMACLSIPMADHQLPVIPCGTAIQNARATKLGDTLCRDGYHLDYVYGRYTAACAWYEFLTGKDVRRNRYKNPQMTKQQRRLTQRAAHKATKGCQR